MAKSERVVTGRKKPLGVGAEDTPRRTRGRTDATQTPVHIHTHNIELSDSLVEYVQDKLGARVGRFALQIERVSVRFDDINGPRGGKDCECRIQFALAGRPDLVVNNRDTDPKRAFDGASRAALRAVKHNLERAGFSQALHRANKVTRASTGTSESETTPTAEPAPPSSRNLRKRTPRSTAALELTTTGARPSRVSTRKSANHVRSGAGLAQRAREDAHAPKTMAASARTRRARG